MNKVRGLITIVDLNDASLLQVVNDTIALTCSSSGLVLSDISTHSTIYLQVGLEVLPNVEYTIESPSAWRGNVDNNVLFLCTSDINNISGATWRPVGSTTKFLLTGGDKYLHIKALKSVFSESQNPDIITVSCTHKDLDYIGTITFSKQLLGEAGASGYTLSLDNDTVILDDTLTISGVGNEKVVDCAFLYKGSAVKPTLYSAAGAVAGGITYSIDTDSLSNTPFTSEKVDNIFHLKFNNAKILADGTSYSNNEYKYVDELINTNLQPKCYHVTYVAKNSEGEELGRTSLNVKIVNIGDGISYKLNVSPLIIPVSYDFSELLNAVDGDTIPLLCKVVKYSSKDAPVVQLVTTSHNVAPTDSLGENGDFWLKWPFANTNLNVSAQDISNAGNFDIDLYVKYDGNWVEVDSETISYSKEGKPSLLGTIQLTNDVIILDDNSNSSDIEAVSLVTAALYQGDTKIGDSDGYDARNVNWNISLDTELSEYLYLTNGDGEPISGVLYGNDNDYRLHLRSGLTSIGQTTSGYITFRASFTTPDNVEINATKICSVLVKDFSSGETYNLVVYPNSVAVDEHGNLYNESESLYIELVSSRNRTINVGTLGYKFKYKWSGGSDALCLFSPLGLNDLDGLLPNKSLIISAYKINEDNSETLLDSETVGFVKTGATGAAGAAASSGISATMDNDSVLLDVSLTNAAIQAATTNVIKVYKNGSLYDSSKYDITPSVVYSSTLGLSITGVLASNSYSGSYRLTLVSGKTLLKGSGYVNYTITPKAEYESDFSEFTIKLSFLVTNVLNGYSYKLIAEPNVINITENPDSTINCTCLKINADGTIETIGSGDLGATGDDTKEYILQYRVPGYKYFTRIPDGTFTVSGSGLYIINLLKKLSSGTYMVVDSETVTAVSNGNPGSKGATYRFLGDWETAKKINAETYRLFESGASNEKYIDIITYNDHFYECSKTHKNTFSTTYTPSSDSSYWKLYDEYENLVTHSLFVYETGGETKTITGGVTGGIVDPEKNDLVIWAGAKNGNSEDANFKVYEDGHVEAKDFKAVSFNTSLQVNDDSIDFMHGLDRKAWFLYDYDQQTFILCFEHDGLIKTIDFSTLVTLGGSVSNHLGTFYKFNNLTTQLYADVLYNSAALYTTLTNLYVDQNKQICTRNGEVYSVVTKGAFLKSLDPYPGFHYIKYNGEYYLSLCRVYKLYLIKDGVCTSSVAEFNTDKSFTPTGKIVPALLTICVTPGLEYDGTTYMTKIKPNDSKFVTLLSVMDPAKTAYYNPVPIPHTNEYGYSLGTTSTVGTGAARDYSLIPDTNNLTQGTLDLILGHGH